MRRQVWISTVLGTQLCVVFFSLMKEHPWEEHLICSPKRGWVLLQVFMHSSMKEHPPLLAANTHCKTIDREKPHIVYVGVKHLFLWSFNFSSTRQQMKTALDRALRLLACHACVWTQRCHSEPQWANCLYLNSPPSELIAGTMNNNCETEPPGFEWVPHHTQLYTMNGSSMQGQIVSLEVHHGELGCHFWKTN